MINGAAMNGALREARVAITGGATLRERVLYNADKATQLTRETEIHSRADGTLISRHSVSGGIAPTGNTALPVAMRVTLPGQINQASRQRVLDAVAELRDAAPVEPLKDTGNSLHLPKAGEVWVDVQPGADFSTPWVGQRFSADDPKVAKLISALHTEQLGRSPYDFHGGDGQLIFQ